MIDTIAIEKNNQRVEVRPVKIAFDEVCIGCAGVVAGGLDGAAGG